MAKIGKKLRAFAELNYPSHAKLSEILKIREPHIYIYFNENSLPGFHLLKILQYIGCELNWLLDDEVSVDNVPEAKIKEGPINYEPIKYIEVYMGQRLKNFGYRKFKTMHKFAEALEIKLPTLYTYINGQALPGARSLAKILKLGCNIEWLVADSEETAYIPHEYQLQKDLENNKIAEPREKYFDNGEKNELYSMAKIKFGSVKEMAKQLGISRQALYPYIQGKPLTEKIIVKLKALGVEMNEEEVLQKEIKHSDYSNINNQNNERDKTIIRLERWLDEQREDKKILNETIKELNATIKELRTKIASLNEVIVRREIIIKEEKEKREKAEENLKFYKIGNSGN